MSREIVNAIVAVVLGAVAARMPAFLRNWVLGLQDRIVDFIMTRFGLPARSGALQRVASAPKETDVKAAVKELAEVIGKPPKK